MLVCGKSSGLVGLNRARTSLKKLSGASHYWRHSIGIKLRGSRRAWNPCSWRQETVPAWSISPERSDASTSVTTSAATTTIASSSTGQFVPASLLGGCCHATSACTTAVLWFQQLVALRTTIWPIVLCYGMMCCIGPSSFEYGNRKRVMVPWSQRSTKVSRTVPLVLLIQRSSKVSRTIPYGMCTCSVWASNLATCVLCRR